MARHISHAFSALLRSSIFTYFSRFVFLFCVFFSCISTLWISTASALSPLLESSSTLDSNLALESSHPQRDSSAYTPHRAQKLPPLEPQPIPDTLTPESNTQQALQERIMLEFIISYKAQTKDGIITGEHYGVSSPITSKAHTLHKAYACKINTPINDLITDDEAYAIKYILTYYKDEVLDCLAKGGAKVRYDGLHSQQTRIDDSVVLSFPPQRIVAYLDNRYLVINVLKERHKKH